MADNEILVNTRYTVEGYQQAITRAEKVGSTLRRMGSDLTNLGYVLDNQFLKSIGHTIQGLQDMASIAEGLIKTLKDIPALGKIFAGVGGAFIGSQIYDATIGKLQGTSTENILSEIKTLLEHGFDTEAIIKDMRIEATNAQIDASNAVFNFKQGLAKNDPRVNFVISQILGGFGGLAPKLGDLAHGAAVVSSDQYKAQAQQQALSNIAQEYNNIGARIKAAATYQAKLASASQTYHAAEFDRKMKIAQLEAETSARRIAAAQALAADLAKMDSTYYANRLKLAESFGLETQRAEEDHQRNMRRLQEGHDKRLRKLAESRDALGIEDEVDAFETERQNAEEEYQVQQSRRNQDYALQLRDMEQAFQQQRQERITAYNQQLVDIANYNTAQRQLIAQQMRDIAEAVLKAFTDAAKNYTASQTTTNNTNQSVVQNNTINGVTDPMAVSQMIHSEVKRIFDTAARR